MSGNVVVSKNLIIGFLVAAVFGVMMVSHYRKNNTNVDGEAVGLVGRVVATIAPTTRAPKLPVSTTKAAIVATTTKPPTPTTVPAGYGAIDVAKVTDDDLKFAEEYANKRRRCEEIYLDYVDKTSGVVVGPETIKKEYSDLGCTQLGF